MKTLTTTARTVCPYCAVGCHLDLVVENGRVRGLDYAVNSPVNAGRLCARGHAALEILTHPERLTRPRQRAAYGWTTVSWNEALDAAAENIQRILSSHGPQALAFLTTAKGTNEENYLIQKLARTLGTHNVDHCARLCHASTLTGLGPMLGMGAATNPLSDLARSHCLFFVGSNLAENHPVAFRWVQEAKDAGAKIVVADPRRTPTAWIADLYLPVRPGTDLALLAAMLHVIFRDGLQNSPFMAQRTSGVEALRASVSRTDPSWAAPITGVPARDIVRAAHLYAKAPRAALIYCMGVTQHALGTETVRACADLALVTGHIGTQGTGLYPVRGQDNVQGACDMGALSGFLPGYRPVTDPQARRFFEEAWGIPKGTLPAASGLTVTDIEQEAGKSIRGVIAVGENPLVTSPNTGRIREALQRLDFFMVMDLFLTETAELAHLVLPAAAWAEKSGSRTNTDRRVQWSPQVVPPPGQAHPDGQMVIELAHRLGLGRYFSYDGPEAVLEEIRRVVPTYAGITAQRLRAHHEGIPWPCLDDTHPGTPVLYENRFATEDGRARLYPLEFGALPEVPDANYPYCLTTGRGKLHYNSGAMTRRTTSLMARAPHLVVELHPEDAEREGFRPEEPVWVVSRRGTVKARVHVTQAIRPGIVFLPFHFPDANRLTQDVLDPWAKIPEYKSASCRLEKVTRE
ncbi:formate dehydrogenase subunit alpha [Desulfosoma caldarium]|uniref:Formate dehydrogenase major subunit n=1 Tax=Desulfosoma caldarium TaxID=610254 RepID=A0A3N1US91_9BACT|nr:formate dehydrogenase subunit alpha [Desulfosoma caldarium]ROQ90711.1 formate dehydrogenase major subunit [Desulfosoma caldarium]